MGKMIPSLALPKPIAMPIPMDAACFALCAASILVYPINHDVAWILALADRVRHGARIYVDVIEVSPPLIAWLNVPICALADLLGLAAGAVFRALVLALALGSVLLASRTAPHRLPFAPLCLAAIGAAGYDFGQREHLAFLLALPYFAAAGLRFEGQPTSRRHRLKFALAAAVGFCIKPHFLLVPVMVEALIVLKRRTRPDGSCYVIAAFASFYLVAVLLFAPEYIGVARMLTKVYAFGLLGISPISFLAESNFYIGVIGLLLALRMRPAGSAVLSTAAVAFAASAMLQAKGWSYHWYPFAALGWLLICMSLGKALPRKVARIATGILCALAFLIAPRSAAVKNPFLPMLAPIAYELGGGPMIILSTTVRVSYPLLTLPGLGNPSRLPVAQLLFASIVAEEPAYETFLRRILVEDMVTSQPNLLIAESHPRGLPPDFDTVSYLEREPEFARAMQSYRLVRVAGGFRIYQRQPARAALKPPSGIGWANPHPAEGAHRTASPQRPE